MVVYLITLGTLDFTLILLGVYYLIKLAHQSMSLNLKWLLGGLIVAGLMMCSINIILILTFVSIK